MKFPSQDYGRKNISTWLWLIKIASGLLLVIFLLIHLFVNHLVAPQGLLDYNGVIQYFHNPFIPFLEGLFLISVVTHSTLGLRAIIIDLHPSKNTLRFWNLFLAILGICAVTYGIWLLLQISLQR